MRERESDQKKQGKMEEGARRRREPPENEVKKVSRVESRPEGNRKRKDKERTVELDEQSELR